MGSGEAGDLSLPVGTFAACKKEEKMYRCTSVSVCTVCICAWVGVGSFPALAPLRCGLVMGEIFSSGGLGMGRFGGRNNLK